MNAPLLIEIADWIIKHPKKFNIGAWCDVQTYSSSSKTTCGTTFCIAGEVMHRAGGSRVIKRTKDVFSGTVMVDLRMTPSLRDALNVLKPGAGDEAADYYETQGELDYQTIGALLLGLTQKESTTLFFEHRWPIAFQKRQAEAKTVEEQAQVAHDRILHMIETRQ